MIKALEKLFTQTLKLGPDLWLYILLAIVVVAFIVTLVVGLLCGEFRAIKARMRGVVNSPDKAVAEMKMMPVSVKKQYKSARMANVRPSDFLSQHDLVDTPYRASLISKIWVVTLVATIICALIAFFIEPLAIETVTEGDGLEFAEYIMPITVLLVGGLLTFIGALIGKCSYGGAVKLYGKFVPAVDGEVKPAAGGQAAAQNAAYAEQAQPMQEQPEQVYAAEPQDEGNVYAEQVAEPYVQQEAYAEQPVAENDDRQAARAEAMARARAEQEAAYAARVAQEEAERQAAARAAAEQARAEQERAARLEAERQAAAARAAQAQAQAAQAQAQAAQAQPQGGTSSADDVIARIEKIDREGAPRETMREVATLLQKERAKPENKTPEQQKKLNEALSKLLKAMSAASRK